MSQRPKDQKILEKAGELFLSQGYRSVSMDAIAAAVPVSKPTLYNHFKDKKALFAAVVTARCRTVLAHAESHMRADDRPEQVLLRIGEAFQDMIFSASSVKMHRIMVAECSEFKEMAQLFYDSGPRQMLAYLSNYLKQQHAKKALKVENPTLSADLFLSSLKGQNHLQFLLGVRSTISKKERQAQLHYAVKMFLTAHYR